MKVLNTFKGPSAGEGDQPEDVSSGLNFCRARHRLRHLDNNTTEVSLSHPVTVEDICNILTQRY